MASKTGGSRSKMEMGKEPLNMGEHGEFGEDSNPGP